MKMPNLCWNAFLKQNPIECKNVSHYLPSESLPLHLEFVVDLCTHPPTAYLGISTIIFSLSTSIQNTFLAKTLRNELAKLKKVKVKSKNKK